MRLLSAALAAVTTATGAVWVVAIAAAAQQGHDQAAPAASPWPKAHADARNTGRGIGRGAIGRVKWVFDTGQPVQSTPVIGADGAVYAGCWDRKAYSLDARTGTKRWEFPCIGRIMGSPALSVDGTVYFASNEGRVHALDAAVGDARWAFTCFSAVPNMEEQLKREGPGPDPNRPGYNPSGYCSIHGSPAVGRDGTVYIGITAGGAGMAAINGRTGATRWERRDGGATQSCPGLMADGTIVESHNDLRLLNAGTGDVVWDIPLPQANGEDPVTSGGSSSTPVIGDDGTIYFGRADLKQTGQFFAIDPRTRRIRWQLRGGNSYGVPALGRDGTVYVGRGSRSDPALCTFYALDGKTGRVRWERQLGAHLFTAPAIAGDGTVYIGNQDWIGRRDGHVYALDGVTGEVRWKVEVRGTPSSPSIGADGTLYVGCGTGVVAIE